MSWGCHPDSMTMASARIRAEAVAGESGTVAYLRAYRDEYQKEVTKNPMRGGEEYMSKIDDALRIWESGELPDVSNLTVPGIIR